MSDNKELTLEQMMDDLENCVRELESDDISLEDSFHIYEKGMKLVKSCNDRIDKVEKDVLVLEDNGQVSVLPPMGN